MKSSGPFHDAYANLAAAIVASGVECHDAVFLKSDWHDTLKLICRLDDEMYGIIRNRSKPVRSSRKRKPRESKSVKQMVEQVK